jgi:hypothetical protein
MVSLRLPQLRNIAVDMLRGPDQTARRKGAVMAGFLLALIQRPKYSEQAMKKLEYAGNGAQIHRFDWTHKHSSCTLHVQLKNDTISGNYGNGQHFNAQRSESESAW